MTLNNTKGRLKGAQTGHSLLKRKADALTKRFRTITAKIDEAKRKMGKVMQLAAFSLAEVNYAVGGIAFMVQESVQRASFKVHARQENVSGVFLPVFEPAQNREGSKGESRLRSHFCSAPHPFTTCLPFALPHTRRVSTHRSLKRRTTGRKGQRGLHKVHGDACRAGKSTGECWKQK